MTKLIGITGYSDSGKTMLVSGLISIFQQRGIRVAAVKHAAHGYDVDVPGKDSWKHYHAGADIVMTVGPDVITTHERLTSSVSLDEVLSRINGVDLILVEGFKHEVSPKILLYRQGISGELPENYNDYAAVVTDVSIQVPIPCFDYSKLEKLADFIQAL